MTDKEACRMIGERAEKLIKEPNVKKKMVEIARTDGKDAAEKWLYRFAIATLFGTN